MSLTAIFAPNTASRRAYTRPRPRPAPVTIVTVPSTLRSVPLQRRGAPAAPGSASVELVNWNQLTKMPLAFDRSLSEWGIQQTGRGVPQWLYHPGVEYGVTTA